MVVGSPTISGNATEKDPDHERPGSEGARGRPGHRHHHHRTADRTATPHRDLVPPSGRQVLHHRYTGRPRSWYANLVAHPAFTFHLKESATADLPATARPVTDPAEREQVLAAILASLPGFADNPGQEPAVWVARSPLVEVTFGN